MAAHFAVVFAIVLAPVAVVIGAVRRWRWVRDPWFRFAHLALILFVVLQVACDWPCPLTRLEKSLRARAGEAVYDEAFIDHWVVAASGTRPSEQAYDVTYCAFGALVVLLFVLVPPRRRRTRVESA